MQAFFALVRSGLWESPADGDFLLSDEEWQAIYDIAAEQTVSGIVSRGIALLPASVAVPDKTVFDFMMEADRIRRGNYEVDTALDTFIDAFSEAGLHPVALKGPMVAAYYPDPSLRQSGDLDIYFQPSEWDAAVALASSKGCNVTYAPDASAHYKWGSVEIDQHRAYFDLHCKQELLPKVPSGYAELLMLSSHILKHCIFSGVGLRQLCDMAVAYKSIHYDAEKLKDYYKSLGLVRWNRLLDAFLAEYLGATRLPYGPGVSSRPLARIVLNGGNFGFYATGRKEVVLEGSEGERKLDTALRMLGRLPFSLRYSPREAFASYISLVKGNL